MDCPDCRHENPPGSRFCNACGERLPAGCPKCGHANPPGSKFCNQCGTNLDAEAPPPVAEAGEPAPAAEVETSSRGSGPRPTPAPEIEPGERPSSLQTLIPDDFAAKLAQAREQQVMVGERRVVTMLFCDLKGSTAAAGTLDPEEWAQIMNGIFEYMIRPVYRYEGTVARLMGDAILAFFGAPVAHEDDPQRAIMAALDIIENFKDYREQIRENWGLEVNFRIGINTGLVMVGTVGSDLQMEYTALGDAINLAARMEQTADPGTIQVAEDTYKRVAPVFEWEPLGETTVKGRAESIRTYRPIRRRTDPGRLRGIAGLDAPMVGRTEETARIREALERLSAGVGGIVFITGEAGLGKSRLIREFQIENQKLKNEDQELASEEGNFQSSISNSPPDWHGTASRSYESTQPYALFQRLLRQVYDVDESDTPLEMWEKFTPVLEKFPPDMADQGLVFEALFSTSGRSGENVPEGEQFKRQLFDLMTHLVETWTDAAPQIIVLDDLHWSDPASIDLLVHLFRLTETHPLLLLCAMRPERDTSAWAAMELARRDYAHKTTEIALSALTASDTDQLVDHLLVVSDLPAPLRKRILEKTEGNPFFIEEVVRVLIDSGAVERREGPDGVTWHATQDIDHIDIPGSLQSLLIARIDRLEDDARRTLQLASVIGRSFYYRILDSISDAVSMARSRLDAHLQALERAEMIRESARIPELEYAFRHALTQEAAYNTILLRERRAFHKEVGEAVEEIFADRLEDFYPLLAHHYGEAQDPRAVRYETLAGDAALRLYAIPEAISHFRNAAALLEKSDRITEESAHVYERLGRCYELISEHDTAIGIYQEMLALSKKHGDEEMELAACIALGKAYAIPTPIQDVEQAKSHSGRGLEIAAKLGDSTAESRLQWNAMLVEMYTGHMDRAIPFGEKSAALARSTGMQTQLAHALHDLGLPYMAVGKLDKSRAVLDEAYEIWRGLGNKPMMAENRSNRSIERTMSGSFKEAIEYSELGFRLADEIDNDWGRANTKAFSPLIYLALGEIDTALKSQRTYLPLMREVGHPGSTFVLASQAELFDFLGSTDDAMQAAEGALWDSEDFPPFRQVALAVSARLRHAAGDVGTAEKLLVEGRQLHDRKTVIHIEIEFNFTEIEIAAASGKAAAAEALLENTLALIERSGARLYLSKARRLLAKIRLAQEDDQSAAEVLAQAAADARKIDHRRSLLECLADLADLEDRRGSRAKADRCREEGRELALWIAGNISDPELKGSFQQKFEAHGIRIS